MVEISQYLQYMNLVIFTMVSSCARSYPTTTSFAVYLNRAIFVKDADIRSLIKGVIVTVFSIVAGLNALLYVLEWMGINKVSLTFEPSMTITGRTPLKDTSIQTMLHGNLWLTIFVRWCMLDTDQPLVVRFLSSCCAKHRGSTRAPMTNSCIPHVLRRTCGSSLHPQCFWNSRNIPKNGNVITTDLSKLELNMHLTWHCP